MSCPCRQYEDADAAARALAASSEAFRVASTLNDRLLARQYAAEGERLQRVALLHLPPKGHA